MKESGFQHCICRAPSERGGFPSWEQGKLVVDGDGLRVHQAPFLAI